MYEITAIDNDSAEIIADLVTEYEHTASHYLMGSLGVGYDTDEDSGPGETHEFTRGQISAAQAALSTIIMPSHEQVSAIDQGMWFLHLIELWFEERPGFETVTIVFC